MPQRLETRKHDFSERVITALRDLVALSRRTSALRFTPPDTLNQLATALMCQLAALCHAQQGALFLVESKAEQEAFVSQPAFSLLTAVQMSEEEAHTALAAYSLTTDPLQLQWSMDRLPTLLWRRSLDPALTNIPPQQYTMSSPTTHLSALLLFVWETSAHAQEIVLQTRDEAMKLLPFLEDAVDTVLLHLLLARGESEPHDEPPPSELLATVEHEFRGPLTTISGYATTLLRYDEQLAPQERQDFLQAISGASAHLGKLIDHFLDLAQFETHTAAFAPVAVDLVALAHEAITAARQNQPHPLILSPILLSAHRSGERGEGAFSRENLVVSGDRRWLRTLLDLLLENAITYSLPEQMIEVCIEPVDRPRLSAVLQTHVDSDPHKALILSGVIEEHEALLEIQVRDHGIGIDPSQLTQIFQRFYRVDTRLTRESNGLGLGLALCKAIVARHRGMLWVESQIGEGSTFHIVLPYEVATASNVL